jgi:hypothetical protein
MVQSFSLSFCLLSVLFVRCLDIWGFFGRRLTLSVFEELVTRQILCRELFVWKFVQKDLAAKHYCRAVGFDCNTKKCLGHKNNTDLIYSGSRLM